MPAFKLIRVAAVCAALLFIPGQLFALELDKLNKDLVILDGKKLEKVKDVDLGSKKYIAFYYSAHWCPPCRAFTPGLSKSYKKLKKKYGDDFELIFVSSDKNENAMAEYMDWGEMEFPALEFKGNAHMSMRPYGASGIPYMVVFDKDGKEILGKGGEKWVHPSSVLEAFEDLLKG
jgi:nucleoredoxin